MSLKWFAVVLQALVLSVFMSVAAKAVTLTPNDPAVSPLAFGTDYDSSHSFGKKISFADVFHFTDVNPFVNWDAAAISNAQFTTLTATWKDVTLNTVVSTTNLLTTTGSFMITLISGHLFDLIIGGKSANTNGLHSYAIAVSAVPLPSAFVLLISGLFGIGVLGRPRRGKMKVSV
jgi:hypothetical protein